MNHRELIVKYLDGQANEAEVATLEHWIGQSIENGRLFVELSLNDGLLTSALESVIQMRARAEAPSDDERAEVMESLIADALKSRRLSELEETTSRQLASEQLALRLERERRRDRALRQRQKTTQGSALPTALTWLAAAAVLGIFALVVSQFTTSDTELPVAQPNRTATQGQGETDDATPALAVLTGSVDARWDGRRRAAGDALHAGDTVRLESGFVEIRAAGGATLTLEGPCELEAMGDGRFALNRGRISADGEGSMADLTIQTPRGDIVNHASAFGVQVASDLSTQVVVFAGRVDLVSPSVPSDPFAAIASSAQLGAGQLALATTGDLQTAHIAQVQAADASPYARSLADAESSAFLYRRAVMDSGPVAYWSFDDDVRRAVPNLVQPGMYDLRALGNPERQASGVVGSSARLDNLLPPYRYFETTSPIDGLTGADQFTLELWFQADRHHHGTLIDLYAQRSEAFAPHMAVIEVGDDTRTASPGGPWIPNTLRGIHRDPPSSEGGSSIYSETPYDADQWHHVVMVKDNGTLRLYMDGRQVARCSDSDPLSANARVILGVAVNIHYQNQNASDIRPFSGLIDEAALYDRALSNQEVAEHYRAAGLIIRP